MAEIASSNVLGKVLEEVVREQRITPGRARAAAGWAAG